jgi:hypothetical protein
MWIKLLLSAAENAWSRVPLFPGNHQLLFAQSTFGSDDHPATQHWIATQF